MFSLTDFVVDSSRSRKFLVVYFSISFEFSDTAVMRQAASRIKSFASWVGIGDNGGMNQSSQSQEKFEVQGSGYTTALVGGSKPGGWTASKEITFHGSATFMDYLHGDVKANEAEAACYYEYARESWQMWKATELRDKVRAKGQLKSEKDFWDNVSYDTEVREWATPWVTELLMCESFPHKDWNELSEPGRKKIMVYARQKVEPLPLQILHYSFYPKDKFPEFNELAAQTKPVAKRVRPGEKQEPAKITKAMVQKSGAVYYCLFNVNAFREYKLSGTAYVQPALVKEEMKKNIWCGSDPLWRLPRPVFPRLSRSVLAVFCQSCPSVADVGRACRWAGCSRR